MSRTNIKECSWKERWSYNGLEIIDCTECGFKHQYPYPSQEAVEKLYKEEYYEEIKPGYLDIVQKDKEHFRLWASSKRVTAERFIQFSGAEMPAVLDIGSSFGQTLLHFADVGWRTVGVEPSTFAADISKKDSRLEVHNATLEAVSTEDLKGPFNLVHMAEVINHLRDPLSTLQRIHGELLCAGGVLIVETGNDFNPLQWATVELYEDVPWWIVPDHISYFDSNSLSRLLERTGFSVKFTQSTFPMEIFPLMGDNYRENETIGKECHEKRVNFEMNLHKTGNAEVLQNFYSALALAGLGRSVIIYAEK